MFTENHRQELPVYFVWVPCEGKLIRERDARVEMVVKNSLGEHTTFHCPNCGALHTSVRITAAGRCGERSAA